ncbi:hypothetical protein DPMN_168269, partial [Dreissena polymorpha]
MTFGRGLPKHRSCGRRSARKWMTKYGTKLKNTVAVIANIIIAIRVSQDFLSFAEDCINIRYGNND